MSTEATPAPGPVSAPATAENFDPTAHKSADLGALMRAAAAIRDNPAKPESTAAPAKTEVPAVPAKIEAPPVPPAEAKAAAEKKATDDATAAAAATAEKDQLPDKFRPRLTNEEDVAIALMAKQKGITLREAAKLYEGTPEKKADAPAAPDPAAEHDKAIKDANDALVATRAALKKANADMDTDAVTELQEKLADQKLAIRDLEVAKKSAIAAREATVDQQQVAIEHKDYQKVIERYPDLAPPKSGEQPSATRQKFNEFVAKRQGDGDLFVREGDKLIPLVSGWRSILAREFAEENNLSAKSKTETTAKAEPPAAPPKPEVPPPAQKPRVAAAATVLTTGDAPESGSTFEASADDVARAIAEGKFSSKQLGQLMRETEKLKKAS